MRRLGAIPGGDVITVLACFVAVAVGTHVSLVVMSRANAGSWASDSASLKSLRAWAGSVYVYSLGLCLSVIVRNMCSRTDAVGVILGASLRAHWSWGRTPSGGNSRGVRATDLLCVPRLSVCLFVCGIYAGVYMRLSVCLFVCGMYVEFDLVATARLCRVSHKMRITKEDGDLWFNKACKSG